MKTPDVCGHYVLIKQDKVEAKTSGGIVIPEDTRKKEQAVAYTGEIVGIGETAWYDYTHKYGERVAEDWAEVGDRVLYTKYGHRHIEVPGEEDDEDYVIVNDGDILLVLEKGEK